ncbi:MAG: sulfatase-like hydrolase/transferase [Candidatus Cryptobacteroides sp.]
MRISRFIYAVPALTICAQAAAGNDGGRPNIIIVVADDLGWGDLGYHGSMIRTPNIDGFVRNGIEMDRFYSAPISSPTRAGLLTGRYPDRFRIRTTVVPPWRNSGLPEGEQTIADVLGRNGYANRALVGKWHLGSSRKAYYPLNRGFTHFYGFLNGMLDYFTHERDGELDWHNDWDSCYDKGYTTDLIANEAVRCISEYSAGGPYFLYVAFNAPHSPYQAPEEEIAKYIDLDEFANLDKKDREGWIYRAMVSRMDAGFGRILDAVEKSGEKDNTIILFMSDNGGVPGMEPYSTNAPLRGNKSDEWEGGLRVPAAISWPSAFEGGRKITQLTGYVDVLPTLADIVGDRSAPERPYDGISIRSVLSGEKKGINRYFYLGMGAAVGSGAKLIMSDINTRLGLEEDFKCRIDRDPSESGPSRISRRDESRLRDLIIQYDTITPYIPELPFNEGKKDYVPPKEWKVVNP